MAKRKPLVNMTSYGIYNQWDASSRELPKIRHITTSIPGELDIEFGYIVNIKQAKNARLTYCIYHPDICDDSGQIMAPFEGREHVRTNDWHFYLGDTLWAPVETKTGPWRMTLSLDETLIADKTFMVEAEAPYEGASFWRRGKLKFR